MAVIFCFGDSITYGAWDIKGGGWVSRLRSYLDDEQAKNPELYYLIHNLGISGETTRGLIKRFKPETEARLREKEDPVFIFAFGANDVCHFGSDFRVPKDEFIANLSKTLDEASGFSSKILLLNITPVLEDVYNAHSESSGKEKKRFNVDIAEYNKAIAELAKNRTVPLVDVNVAYTQAGPRDLFSEDGLHPNETGHQLIFERVKEALGEQK